jgi:hypothetical protein
VENIKVGLGDIEWSATHCIDLDQGRDKCSVPVNTGINLPVP